MKRKHGHASVEEHPKGSGKYRVRAHVGGRLRTILSGVSRPEAQAAADAYARLRQESEIREGITLSQFGIGFLERRELSRRVRSVAKDRNRWKNTIDSDPIGELAVSTLRRSDVVEWRDRMLGKRLAPQTIRNALNLLRVALDEAADRELLPANPAKEVKLPRGAGATQDEDLSGVLLPAEQVALLAAVPERERPIVVVSLLLGLRWSEAAQLRWADVRDDHVLIRRSTAGGPTKGGKPRRMPLSPSVEAALAAARGRAGKSPHVFGRPRTTRPSGWKRWVRAAGIERRVRFHDLRHTCATSLLGGWWGRRWSLEEVRQMLGHSSIQVTERYARLLDETLRNAVAGTLFPHGNAFEVTTRDDSSAIGFLNRRPQVRLLPGAPSDSAALDAARSGELGTKWEQPASVPWNAPARRFRAKAWLHFAAQAGAA